MYAIDKTLRKLKARMLQQTGGFLFHLESRRMGRMSRLLQHRLLDRPFVFRQRRLVLLQLLQVIQRLLRRFLLFPHVVQFG